MVRRYDLTAHYKSPPSTSSDRALSQVGLLSLEGAGMLLTMKEQKYYFPYKNIMFKIKMPSVIELHTDAAVPAAARE
jgi:hypothetical protein